jgi:hypothetical protein
VHGVTSSLLCCLGLLLLLLLLNQGMESSLQRWVSTCQQLLEHSQVNVLLLLLGVELLLQGLLQGDEGRVDCGP